MRYTIPLCKWFFSIEELGYSIKVTVPHTWNTDDAVMRHRGDALYETDVFVGEEQRGSKAFISFNAVYHTAKVFINGSYIGMHTCSGYTPFRFDVTDFLRYGEKNNIKVYANNTMREGMFPYKDQFDWADDGGMIRKAELCFLPADGIEYIHISEDIQEIKNGRCSGKLNIKTAMFSNAGKSGTVRVYDNADHKVVLEKHFETIKNETEIAFNDLKLWSCYSPNLYVISLQTQSDIVEVRTGLRKIETRGEKVYLNGEEIFLKGCEWMPGSHPDFGMAEPLEHSIKRLKQLKNAGCVFTRFHWQQDDTVFDWCDENGLLVQEEIPYWGYPKEATDKETGISKQHADEMVYYHYNHPSIICWGVGNEAGGETKATIGYVDEMVRYFKAKDSRRLVNYVSNSMSYGLHGNADDAALHGDIAMWNDYLGFWEACEDVEGVLIQTAQKAKGMPLLISEFGLCEPYFKGGDEKRCEVLKNRLEIYHTIKNICGYMWFSLNDYRTHCGEAGSDKMKQRIHGSTDLYGNEKPSYRLFCRLQEDD